MTKCEKCDKPYPRIGKWYRRGRIIKWDEITELPDKLCGDCYKKLDVEERTKWAFELENFGIK